MTELIEHECNTCGNHAMLSNRERPIICDQCDNGLMIKYIKEELKLSLCKCGCGMDKHHLLMVIIE